MIGATAKTDWAGFRFRRWLQFSLIGAALLSAIPPIRGFGLTFPLAGAAVAAGFWHAMLLCPKCGKTFFRKGAWHNGLARFCLNCGLKRGQDPS